MASPYDLTHAGHRPAKRPYVDNRTAALAAATAQFDSLVREQAHQEEIDAAVQLAAQQQQQFASTSTSQFAPVSNEPPKRKITRKRQVLSCRPCTTRKIRCTRINGPGAPCQSCEKRGEAALCDVGGGPGGTTPAPSPGPSSTVAVTPSYGQQTPQQQHHHHHHHHRHPHHAAARAPSPGSMLPALPPALAAAAAAASPGPFAYGQVLPPPMHHAINIASPGSLDSYVVAVPTFLYSFRFMSLLLTKDVVCWQGIELRRPPRRTRTQDRLSRVGPPRSRSGTTLPWSCCYCWWWRWGRRSWCTTPRRRLAPLQRSSSRQQRRGRGRQLEPPDDRLAQAEARSNQGRVGVAGWTRFGDGRCRSHSRRYR